MRKTIFGVLAISSLVVGAVACGGGDDTSGTGTDDMAMQVFRVQSGGYTVSNLVKGDDGCKKELESPAVGFSGSKLNVSNDGHGKLSLGSLVGPSSTPSYTPEVYSQGEGTFSDAYHATTTMSAHVIADSTQACQWDVKRDNVVTVTAENSLHMQFTETLSNVNGCGGDPPGPTCTSTYSYDLKL